MVREDTAARVRQVISRVCLDGTVTAKSDGSVHHIFPVAPSVAGGESLLRWVVQEGATRTIEVGFGYGLSALFICEGLARGTATTSRHVVIDPFQAARFSNIGLQLLDEAGVTSVEHIAQESQLALPRLLAEGRQFDFAFVDGNHRFDWVFVDLYYLGRLLQPGSAIFLDDYQLPGVARATRFFLRNLGWTIEEHSDADPLHEWAAVRTARMADNRPFTHFVDF